MAINQFEFQYVTSWLKQSSAIVIAPGKEYLVENRLEILAMEEGLTLPNLLTELRLKPVTSSLHKKVIEAMTTNETFFF